MTRSRTWSLFLAAALAACQGVLPRREVAAFRSPVVSCAGEQTFAASRVLRSGENIRDHIQERFTYVERGDCAEVTVRHEWQFGGTDVHAWFMRGEAGVVPQRVLRRSIFAGPQAVNDRQDLRLFDVFGGHARMAWRSIEGRRRFFEFRGGRPQALITIGRGMLTAWLRSAELEVGGRVRVPVLDIRERTERVRDVTLSRLADDDVPELGRRVRVYTIFGREPIFADQDNVVVGDLMGMVSSETDFETDPRISAANPLTGDAHP